MFSLLASSFPLDSLLQSPFQLGISRVRGENAQNRVCSAFNFEWVRNFSQDTCRHVSKFGVIHKDEWRNIGCLILSKESLQQVIGSPEQTHLQFLAFPIPRRGYGAYPMNENPFRNLFVCSALHSDQDQLCRFLGSAEKKDIWTHVSGRKTKGGTIAIV